MPDDRMEQAARQLLRALRAHRSQVQFSRRLGYKSNVAADWEAGRRFPTAIETLRAAGRVGLDVPEILRQFRPRCAVRFTPDDAANTLAAWLQELRGGGPMSELAERCGRSRHQIGRWLNGTAQPRLPEFLDLVQALTGRVADLVALLVPVEEVPAFAEAHARRAAIRRLSFDLPWTSAVLTFLETGPYTEQESHDDQWLARRLGAPQEAVVEALRALESAALIEREKGKWHVVGSLTVDVAASQEQMLSFKRHWAHVARERLEAPRRATDQTSINLFAVSSEDMDRIRTLQRQFYREVRSIVAASGPSEAMGLLVIQLRGFGPLEGEEP